MRHVRQVLRRAHARRPLAFGPRCEPAPTEGTTQAGRIAPSVATRRAGLYPLLVAPRVCIGASTAFPPSLGAAFCHGAAPTVFPRTRPRPCVGPCSGGGLALPKRPSVPDSWCSVAEQCREGEQSAGQTANSRRFRSTGGSVRISSRRVRDLKWPVSPQNPRPGASSRCHQSAAKPSSPFRSLFGRGGWAWPDSFENRGIRGMSLAKELSHRFWL